MKKQRSQSRDKKVEENKSQNNDNTSIISKKETEYSNNSSNLFSEQEKEKLKNQNNNLKLQLKELINQLDAILVQQQQKKIIHKRDDMPEIKGYQIIFKSQIEMNDYRRKQEVEKKSNNDTIQQLKRQLENTFEFNKFVDQENQIKNLKSQLNELVQEGKALTKVSANQKKALKVLNEQEFLDELAEMNSKIQHSKEITRQLNEQLIEEKNKAKKSREVIMLKQKKVEELEQKIKDNQKVKQMEITENVIELIEQKVLELEQEKQLEEKKQQEKFRQYEQSRSDLRNELEQKSAVQESRAKELRINKLRLSEYIRLAKELSEGNTTKTSFQKKKTNQEEEVIKIATKPNLLRKNSQNADQNGNALKSNQSNRAGSIQEKKNADQKTKEKSPKQDAVLEVAQKDEETILADKDNDKQENVPPSEPKKVAIRQKKVMKDSSTQD